MTTVKMIIHRKGDPPIDFFPPSGTVVHVPDNLTFALLEGGMQSGDPSVAILGVSHQGYGVMLETSLDKLLTTASGMYSAAIHQLGWERQEGYASLVPNSIVKEQRFHRNGEDLGRPCHAKVCNQKHYTALWRVDE